MPSDNRFIYDLMMSTLKHQVVGFAIRLGLFDFLAEGPATAKKIHTQFALGDRGGRALLLCLCSLDLLRHTEDQAFELSEQSRTFLVSGSPLFVGTHLTLHSTQFDRFLVCATKDEPLLPERVARWEQGKAVPDAADSTKRMHALTAAAGVGLAHRGYFSDHVRVLDIAGGSGSMSIALARQHPALRVTVLDLPEVCSTTREYITRAGLSERIDTCSADMFRTSWPRGYDAILFSNVFHDWGTERCGQLARKAFDALESGGSVYLHEMLTDGPNEASVTTALFSFMMLLTTRGKQYSADELNEILVEAGFDGSHVRPALGYFSAVQATKK